MRAFGASIGRDVAAAVRRIASDGADAVAPFIQIFEASRWPEVAWRFSNLSTDSSPLMFDFSSRDDRLRCACEVAGPELDARARLDAALDLIAHLGGTPPPAALVGRWKAKQSEHPLRWGAWVGMRHGGARESFKTYVEVPRTWHEPVEARSTAVVPSSRLKMIGYDCDARAEEHYYRQPEMSYTEREIFLAFMRATPRRAAVLDAFVDLCGLPLQAAMQWINFGYSIAGDARDVAMFVRSRSLGDVARVRSCFLAHEDRAGRRCSAYRGLLGRLVDERLPDHEIVSLIPHASGGVEMRVGLSAAALARLSHP